MLVLDLFSGIGGFSLGLERCGMRTVAFCEIDPFCREWLAQQWPGVPVFPDVRELDGRAVGHVDIVCGGFPCQDVSAAGNQRGLAGERSGLWFEMCRIVCEVRPAWVIVENVTALRTNGADQVLGDLENAGYAGWPFVVGADDIGAPHRRKRVWIIARTMADADRWRREGFGLADDGGLRSAPGDISDGRGRAWPNDSGDSAPPMGDADRSGLEGLTEPDLLRRGSQALRSPPATGVRWPAWRGEPQHEWEARRVVSDAECGLGVSDDGIPAYMGAPLNRARLKAAGNAVVPWVIETLGRSILEVERRLF